MNRVKRYLEIFLAVIFLVPLFIAFLPILILYGIINFIIGLWLKFRFYLKWKRKGKNIILIYSESPNWQEYIEENILPKIESKTILINWSERSKWKKRKPLEVKIFHHFGGDTEFNPMALVFIKPWKIKKVRFFQAFKDYKHGKDYLLKQSMKELFELAANQSLKHGTAQSAAP